MINMRLSKEGDARKQAEDNLRKNNERFSTDQQKFNYSLQNSSKDHDQMIQKLQDSEKQL